MVDKELLFYFAQYFRGAPTKTAVAQGPVEPNECIYLSTYIYNIKRSLLTESITEQSYL